MWSWKDEADLVDLMFPNIQRTNKGHCSKKIITVLNSKFERHLKKPWMRCWGTGVQHLIHIELSFGTIRHSTKGSKGCLSRDGMMKIVFKIWTVRQKTMEKITWLWLTGQSQRSQSFHRWNWSDFCSTNYRFIQSAHTLHSTIVLFKLLFDHNKLFLCLQYPIQT